METKNFDRALMASRFVAADSEELEALMVEVDSVIKVHRTIAALERTRSEFGRLAADRDLALCYLREALQDA